jgi:hypothetical protein
MPSVAIERALDALRRRTNEMERQCTMLREKIAADREEEKLLTRILSVRRGELAQNQPASASVPVLLRSSDPRPADSPVQAVIEELTSAGRPLHISDLMRLLALRKVAISGAGTQANLITYLRRDRRFVRPSRGMYALAEWGLDAMPPTRRRKRRKRVKARAS